MNLKGKQRTIWSSIKDEKWHLYNHVYKWNDRGTEGSDDNQWKHSFHFVRSKSPPTEHEWRGISIPPWILTNLYILTIAFMDASVSC